MKAAERFFGNKKYVFRKKLHVKSLGKDYNFAWIKEIDGKEIKVISPYKGSCNGYIIRPNWCEEIYNE